MQSKCEDLGGSLASIRSREENDAVKDLLNQIKWRKDDWGKLASGVWLAGSDSGSEGRWYWGSDRDTSTWTFSDWRLPHEPNNGGWGNDAENHVVMTPTDWRWNDVRSNEEHFPLCEIPNVNPITG
ncbi:mannose-binding protein c [Plakobranchus ocellatus]|uniref:Mannose-binding protein c n=1 Tax=Plakobranchus ocellatus TaxID=259542 RepID=A0AAV4ADU9_9GAST|nr:mannose-binding protein c [Plakobranchus ocellatus]